MNHVPLNHPGVVVILCFQSHGFGGSRSLRGRPIEEGASEKLRDLYNDRNRRPHYNHG